MRGKSSIFEGFGGDSSLSSGGDRNASTSSNGSHSVVSWQMVDLEETRWFIHTSGSLAGLSGRLDSARTAHQSTYMLPLHRQWGFLHGRSGLQEAQEVLA